MPVVERPELDTTIHYEEVGQGFPVLLIAPGGMESAITLWERSAINPLDVLREDFRLIAMDQRNAGESTGPLETDDPWGMYARDQLGLLDHLGVTAFHVFGSCIGGPYALRLIQEVPDRVCSAVLMQPVGVNSDNAALYQAMWREWGERLQNEHRFSSTEISRFGTAMWTGDFVLSVSRQFLRQCPTPLLVLPGADPYHPTATGEEIARLAPDARLVMPWKDPTYVDGAIDAIRAFLHTHVAT